MKLLLVEFVVVTLKIGKRNSEIVPLLSCNWTLVVPPRANSSRSGPISPLSFVSGCPYSALCCYCGIAQNASGKNLRQFVSVQRSGDLKSRTGWGGGEAKGFVVSKKRVGARGEFEHEQDRGNSTEMLQKTI